LGLIILLGIWFITNSVGLTWNPFGYYLSHKVEKSQLDNTGTDPLGGKHLVSMWNTIGLEKPVIADLKFKSERDQNAGTTDLTNTQKTTAVSLAEQVIPKAPIPATQIDKPKPAPIIETPVVEEIKTLEVSAIDGTLDLQLLASNLPPEEAFLLGLGVLLTGADTYAVRFRFENTGTVPIRININRIRVHFGNESVGVSTIDHPDFLSNGVLMPGDSTEGLVMYRARVDIGAAMRFGLGGKISYSDKDVDVSYR